MCACSVQQLHLQSKRTNRFRWCDAAGRTDVVLKKAVGLLCKQVKHSNALRHPGCLKAALHCRPPAHTSESHCPTCHKTSIASSELTSSQGKARKKYIDDTESIPDFHILIMIRTFRRWLRRATRGDKADKQ